MESKFFVYLIMLLMMTIPPAIVHLIDKDKERTTVSFIFTCFFIIPGYIHVLYVIAETLYLKYFKAKRSQQI